MILEFSFKNQQCLKFFLQQTNGSQLCHIIVLKHHTNRPKISRQKICSEVFIQDFLFSVFIHRVRIHIPNVFCVNQSMLIIFPRVKCYFGKIFVRLIGNFVFIKSYNLLESLKTSFIICLFFFFSQSLSKLEIFWFWTSK